MGNKRICVLLFCLVFGGICAAAQTEPNDAPLKLKFQASTTPQNWTVRGEKDEKGETIYYRNPGPIKPKYVAEVIFSRKVGHGDEVQVLKRVEKSLLAEKLSQAQKDFLKTGHGILVDYERRRIPDSYSIWFYAVSQDDARKMAEAFIEILTEEAGARMQGSKRYLRETQEKIVDITKRLPEKEAQAEAAESKYREVKNIRYFSFADAEASEKAKETMLQMGKMLDVLDIELAGIREKLSAIEAYRNSTEFSDTTRDKLEQMFVEQMIELKGAEARRQAIFQVLNREKAYCNFFEQWNTLEGEAHRLRERLRSSEATVRNLEKDLANPSPAMLPPKVFQNKVTIYPVRVED